MVVNPTFALITVLVLSALAEILHVRRCRAVGRLAFGPVGRPRRWVMVTPLLRVASLGLMTWGFLTLLSVDEKKFETEEIPEDEMNRILIVYDVSPSMYIKDAGPAYDDEIRQREGGGFADDEIYDDKVERYVAGNGTILRKPVTRARRSAELIDSIFERIELQQTLISVVAAYTDGRPVVIDTRDLMVVRNIFNNLPLKYAFGAGQTDLVKGIESAAEVAREWPSETTTLFVISDGGTSGISSLPVLPPSISDVVVIGVGRTGQGTFIDGHFSKQESSVLGNLAQRLRGVYIDGNEKHVPLENFESLAMDISQTGQLDFGPRVWAIIAIAVGAFLLAIMPVKLAAFGAAWRILTPREATS
jgi:Ca-activated chloride channel family protein